MTEPKNTKNRSWRAIMWMNLILGGLFILAPVAIFGISALIPSMGYMAFKITIKGVSPAYVMTFVPYFVGGALASKLSKVNFRQMTKLETFNGLLQIVFVVSMSIYLLYVLQRIAEW